MTTTRAVQDRATGTIPAPRDHTARETVDPAVLNQLADSVVHDLFGIGLHLHAVLPMLTEETAQRLTAAIDETDRIIRHIRDVVFSQDTAHAPSTYAPTLRTDPSHNRTPRP